jgi:8-oxo-dGTP pyrophosphatase MutT (NUDIX family)
MREFAGVLIKQGEYYLLQHRDNIPAIVAPNKYSVWGGAVEGKESFIEAAIRELKEETGLVLDATKLKELKVFTLSKEENLYGDYPARMSVFLLEISESYKVECLEGQGIVRFSDLRDVPTDKLSFPLNKVIQFITKGTF